MSRILSYLIGGAAVGGLIGGIYGIYDGLQHAEHGTLEALFNMGIKNVFTREYRVGLKDAFAGMGGGIALGGLAGIVDALALKVKDKVYLHKK
jgi:hypothetical protein